MSICNISENIKKSKTMKTLKQLCTAALLLTSGYLSAQSTGTIKGTIKGDDGAPLFGALIRLYEDATMVTGTTTDFDGNYSIKDITPGDYDMEISYMNMGTKRINKVNVDPVQIAYINTKLAPNLLGTVEVTAEKFEKSIINPIFSTMTPINIEQIEHMAVGKGDIIGMIVNVTPGVQATDDGKDLYVRGSRRGTTQYIIDGNKIMGSPDVPGMGIAGMEVLTGGVPAEYGDCTGGIVVITTKEYKWEMRKKEMQRRDREEREKAKTND
ncbi:MAG: enterobactin receptor protein [Bacteroidota bacterium]|jgi:hypothetical protein|nr:enterobactin receptor protein [Bacteroidota bacterium]